uniref:FH2 domain-containing protein n=1 Tax=Macrostomum lignano TaxID=282301 RepID=A0A1I8F4U7_9PLAT
LEIQNGAGPGYGTTARLPIDFLFPPRANEYKFLIRGYFNQRATSMKQERGKLPEDCPGVASFYPDSCPKRTRRTSSSVSTQAFYRTVSETGSGNSTRTRWYLGFKPNAAHAARGGRLRGGGPGSIPRRFPTGRRSIWATFRTSNRQCRAHRLLTRQHLKIGDKSSAIKHVNEKFAPEDCNRAKVADPVRHQPPKPSFVWRAAPTPPAETCFEASRAQQAGLSTADIAAGEKALNGYLRGGRCVREELAVTFQSAAVADLVMNLQSQTLEFAPSLPESSPAQPSPSSQAKIPSGHQRNLRKFFRDKLGVRAGEGFDRTEGPKVLNFIPHRAQRIVAFDANNSGGASVAPRQKQVLSALKQDMAVNELGDEMRSFYFKDKLKQLETVDAAKFILLLKQKANSRPASAKTEPRQSSSSGCEDADSGDRGDSGATSSPPRSSPSKSG